MEILKQKKWIFVSLGILIAILPALGFPRVMKDFLYIASGVAILWLSLKEENQSSNPPADQIC